MHGELVDEGNVIVHYMIVPRFAYANFSDVQGEQFYEKMSYKEFGTCIEAEQGYSQHIYNI